jgi:hypothetical protein
MARFAEKEGFAFDKTFIEPTSGDSAALDALIEDLRQHDGRDVVVPSLFHLARVPGLPLAAERLEWEAGARVLVLYPAHKTAV